MVPGLVNLFTQLPVLSSMAKLAAGMPQKRLNQVVTEVIQLVLRDGEHGPVGIYAEDRTPGERSKAQKRSMVRAGALAGALIAGGVLFGVWSAKKAA